MKPPRPSFVRIKERIHPPLHQAATAFTLIELLTVIAIIGVLAAITLPVIGNVRSNARAAKCVSNLRQIGVAAQMWAADNKDRIVPVFDPGDPSAANWRSLTTWAGMLAPYVGWKKPDGATAFRASSDVPVFECPDRKDVFGYGYNYTYLSWIGTGYRRWARYPSVPRPSKTLMLTDVAYDADPSQWRPFVRPSFTSATDSVVDYRHGGGSANVLWVDGHVSSVSRSSQLLLQPDHWGTDVPRSVSPL